MPNIPHDDLLNSLLEYVDRESSPTGCWLWTRGIHHSGYGITHVNRKQKQVHRLFYELIVGDIPAGMFACHTCDVRACCNPDHIFIGDQTANMSDCVRKGRANKPRGERHSAAKITEDQAREIYRLRHEERVKLRVIAERFGVSIGAVRGITNGRNWPSIK